MKTPVNFTLCLLAAVIVVAVSCKGKTASGSASPTGTEKAAAAKGNSVMDSLNITDPDEKKICALYDEAITDYLSNAKVLTSDTSKAAEAQRKALDAKWQAKEKEIRPQVEAWQRKVATNPAEAMKFAQFSTYESKRLMGIMALYQKALMKNMPVNNPPGN